MSHLDDYCIPPVVHVLPAETHFLEDSTRSHLWVCPLANSSLYLFRKFAAFLDLLELVHTNENHSKIPVQVTKNTLNGAVENGDVKTVLGHCDSFHFPRKP